MGPRPNAAEVGGRLLALRAVITHALATPPRDFLEQWLEKDSERAQFVQERESWCNDFWNTVNSSPISTYLSAAERQFAKTTIDTMPPEQHAHTLWSVEAAQVLTWSLNLISQLPAPDAQADFDLLRSFILNRPANFLGAECQSLFDRVPALRPEEEIDHARDLAEFWHWRSRTEELIREGRPFPSEEEIFAKDGLRSYQDIVRLAAKTANERGEIEVIGEDFAVKGKPYGELSDREWSEVRSISIERHTALNWLCGYSPQNDWDATPTET